MAISYNNLWKLLIDKEMNKGDLCNKAKISKGTMAKMTNNEPVTLTVIEKICDALQCDIGDVCEAIPVKTEEQKETTMATQLKRIEFKQRYPAFHQGLFIVLNSKRLPKDQADVNIGN